MLLLSTALVQLAPPHSFQDAKASARFNRDRMSFKMCRKNSSIASCLFVIATVTI
jgi:hypothetical protein